MSSQECFKEKSIIGQPFIVIVFFLVHTTFSPENHNEHTLIGTNIFTVIYEDGTVKNFDFGTGKKIEVAKCWEFKSGRFLQVVNPNNNETEKQKKLKFFSTPMEIQ